MFRAIGYPLLFLAMFSIAGGHWAVLQSVAWTGMIIEYSKGSTLGAALKKTFGGNAPCEMCKTIDAEKQKESRLPSPLKPDKKAEKFLVSHFVRVKASPSQSFSYAPLVDAHSVSRSEAPPAQVPIAA